MSVIKEKSPTTNNKRNFTNKPETRYENILNELEQNKKFYIIKENNKNHKFRRIKKFRNL